MAINQETIAAIEELFEREREHNKRERESFWIAPDKHFLHHRHIDNCMLIDKERQANHEFISSIRSVGGESGKKAVQGVVWGCVVLLGIAAWNYLKTSIASGR